jgi:uncharacterized protein involved in exopolysaccharide biosynthesis
MSSPQHPAGTPKDSLGLAVLTAVLWKSKWLILLCGIIGCVALGVRAHFAVPVYRTVALLTMADDASDPQPGLGAVGALASLTGISLNGAANRRSEYVALLTSRQVISDLIRTHNLQSEIIPNAQSAMPDPAAAEAEILNTAVSVFLDDILTVTENVRTGLINIQVEWKDRVKAASWTNEIVALVNQKARDNAITEAKRTIEYLNRELERTDLLTVREGIYRLLEANLRRAALANVREQYALRVVDPPYIPNENTFVRPQRLLEPLAGLLLGLILGSAWAVLLGRARLWGTND